MCPQVANSRFIQRWRLFCLKTTLERFRVTLLAIHLVHRPHIPSQALVNVGAELVKDVSGRVSTEVDPRLAHDTAEIVYKVTESRCS